MTNQSKLVQILPDLLGSAFISTQITHGEVTCDIDAADIVSVCQSLRDNEKTCFDQLMDLCAIDYIDYGKEGDAPWTGDRYMIVYHLLSLKYNTRLRIRASLGENDAVIDSVIGIWSAADWFEREAFDLFGVIFVGHPDLRRLLTDYGFIGHPFRKDFPLSGKVEMRYDENQGRVIYQPVTIEPRTLVPRTIRNDRFSNSLRSNTTVQNGAE